MADSQGSPHSRPANCQSNGSCPYRSRKIRNLCSITTNLDTNHIEDVDHTSEHLHPNNVMDTPLLKMITPEEVTSAFKKTKQKRTLGPDNISNSALKEFPSPPLSTRFSDWGTFLQHRRRRTWWSYINPGSLTTKCKATGQLASSQPYPRLLNAQYSTDFPNRWKNLILSRTINLAFANSIQPLSNCSGWSKWFNKVWHNDLLFKLISTKVGQTYRILSPRENVLNQNPWH